MLPFLAVKNLIRFRFKFLAFGLGLIVISTLLIIFLSYLNHEVLVGKMKFLNNRNLNTVTVSQNGIDYEMLARDKSYVKPPQLNTAVLEKIKDLNGVVSLQKIVSTGLSNITGCANLEDNVVNDKTSAKADLCTLHAMASSDYNYQKEYFGVSQNINYGEIVVSQKLAKLYPDNIKLGETYKFLMSALIDIDSDGVMQGTALEMPLKVIGFTSDEDSKFAHTEYMNFINYSQLPTFWKNANIQSKIIDFSMVDQNIDKVFVQVDDLSKLDTVSAAIESMGFVTEYTLKKDQSYQDIEQSKLITKSVVLGVSSLIVALLSILFLAYIVKYRTYDFGILKSMGYSNSHLLNMNIYESTAQSVILGIAIVLFSLIIITMVNAGLLAFMGVFDTGLLLYEINIWDLLFVILALIVPLFLANLFVTYRVIQVQVADLLKLK